MSSAGTTAYSYDPNGNRTGKSDAEGLTQYQYNYDNLLSELIDAEGNTTAYTFDAFNRRTAKLTGKANDDTRYLYDGIDVLQEISGPQQQQIAAYYRANNMIVTRQEYNLGGDNDGLNRPEEGRSFYAYDGLGSVAALTNHQGNRKTRYQYDAFGKVMEGDLSENPYAFTGKRFDTESGFYHFHFRKYDPETGVWTTPDPIGIMGGLNLYRYVRNNPVRFVDRWGLYGEGVAGEGGGGSTGGGSTGDSSGGADTDGGYADNDAAAAEANANAGFNDSDSDLAEGATPGSGFGLNGSAYGGGSDGSTTNRAALNPLPSYPSFTAAFPMSDFFAPVADIVVGVVEAGFSVAAGVFAGVTFGAGFVVGPEAWAGTAVAGVIAIEGGVDAYGRIRGGVERLGEDKPCP